MQSVKREIYETPNHPVCKPAYLVLVPSQDKLGGLCQEGHPVCAYACVIFMLYQKIQKMANKDFR